MHDCTKRCCLYCVVFVVGLWTCYFCITRGLWPPICSEKHDCIRDPRYTRFCTRNDHSSSTCCCYCCLPDNIFMSKSYTYIWCQIPYQPEALVKIFFIFTESQNSWPTLNNRMHLYCNFWFACTTTEHHLYLKRFFFASLKFVFKYWSTTWVSATEYWALIFRICASPKRLMWTTWNVHNSKMMGECDYCVT